MMDEYRLNGISCIPYDFHEVWSIQDSNELRDALNFERRTLLRGTLEQTKENFR